jgi:hypothetical protein
MKPQVYKDPRPAEYFDEFHDGARRGVGWTYTFARTRPRPQSLQPERRTPLLLHKIS